jgi:hypothetical protein
MKVEKAGSDISSRASDSSNSKQFPLDIFSNFLNQNKDNLFHPNVAVAEW